MLQIISELVESCRNHDFTDIVVLHEHRGEPDGLVVCHLPYGPTAYFGLYNTVIPPLCYPLIPFTLRQGVSLQLKQQTGQHRLLPREKYLPFNRWLPYDSRVTCDP